MGYFILIFAATAVVIIVVGFIGNKIVDGASNAIRARKYANRAENVMNEAVPDSLASRNAAMSRQIVPSAFCTCCGAKIDGRSAFCSTCGANGKKVEKTVDFIPAEVYNDNGIVK